MSDIFELPPPDPRWYCLRTGPKQEEVAARSLRLLGDVGVFLPRIRFRRPTRRGPVWFTEALFPRYLFARFDRARMSRMVVHSRGVTGLVHFGEEAPPIPDGILDRLRAELGGDDTKVFDMPIEPGDVATVIQGPLQGLEVVVTQILPAPERVKVLLTFLGREMEVEVVRDNLALPRSNPLRASDAAPVKSRDSDRGRS